MGPGGLKRDACGDLRDALTVSRLGRRSAGDDHADALRILATVEMPAKDRDELSKRLSRLLGAKNLAEYVDALCEEDEATRALVDMRRLRDRVRALVSAV